MEENEAAADADPAARPPATEPADGEPPSPPEAELNTNESLLAEHGTEDDAPASDAPGTDERDDGAESAAMALIAGEQASPQVGFHFSGFLLGKSYRQLKIDLNKLSKCGNH